MSTRFDWLLVGMLSLLSQTAATAVDLPLERLGGGAEDGNFQDDLFAVASGLRVDDEDWEFDPSLASSASVASVTNDGSGANADYAGEAWLSVATNGSTSLLPQLNAAGLAQSNGMGSSWFSTAHGHAITSGNFEVLPLPDVTGGTCVARIFVQTAGLHGGVGSGHALIELVNGPVIDVTVQSHGNGWSQTMVSVNGDTVLSTSGSGIALRVEFPAGPGSIIHSEAEGGATTTSSSATLPLAGSGMYSTHVDFKVVGIESPDPPTTHTSVTQLEWDPVNEEWVDDEVIFYAEE